MAEVRWTVTPDTNVMPDDDYMIEDQKIRILNRIDQGEDYGCGLITRITLDGVECCGLPEHDPYSDRCLYHWNIDGARSPWTGGGFQGDQSWRTRLDSRNGFRRGSR